MLMQIFWVMMIIFWVMMMIFLVIMMYFFALQHVTTNFVQISRIFPRIPLKFQNFLKIFEKWSDFLLRVRGAPCKSDKLWAQNAWSLNVACGAALGVTWTFDLWKQFCVCETYTPTHMALGRGADEAATARKGQRENRDESGERCDSGV